MARKPKKLKPSTGEWGELILELQRLEDDLIELQIKLYSLLKRLGLEPRPCPHFE